MTTKANKKARTPDLEKVPAVSGNFDPSQYRVKGDIVLRTLSIKGVNEGDSLYIRAESEITRVTQTDEKTGEIKMDKSGEHPALLAVIIAFDLRSNMRGQMVLPAIVERGMTSAGELTGRVFKLTKGRSLGQNKANLWEVVELEK